MRLTERDMRLLRDVALSHVVCRDQLMALEYFSSVTRVNTRLRELRQAGFLRRIETPFFSQSLFMIGRGALPVLGAKIGHFVSGRSASPRFIQHALSTTNVRIAMLQQGAEAWRFEQQLLTAFEFAGKRFEIRPDGLSVRDSKVTAVEVDLGHVSPGKFREKLRAFDAFIASGECERHWQVARFDVLAITTGPRRAMSLSHLVPDACRFQFATQTFKQLGASLVGGWS